MDISTLLGAAIAAARGAQVVLGDLTDDDLLGRVAEVEELGRLVDGMRVAAAREIETRSRPVLGEERLSFRRGARDGAELVRQLARIGHGEAKRRVGLGMALAPRPSLLGGELPGEYAPLADAVQAGLVGAESARVIINRVKALRRRVPVELLDGMVVQLTDAAMVNDVEQLRLIAHEWGEILDPSGAEPRHDEQRRKRSFRVGATRADGTTLASVVMTAEHLALLNELRKSRRRGVAMERTEPGSDDDADTSGGEWREASAPDDGDPRTREQQDYDALFEVLVARLKAEQAEVATEVIHETVVTITAAELQDQQGCGWAPGVLAGLPIPVIEQRICSGGTRLLVTDSDGEVLSFGRSRRLFSPAQRKALMVEAGGRCQYPGCTTPAPFLEAHHAAWFCRDEGPTDIGNGIMLCSYHHHLMHATHSPVKIVRHDGDLWIVPQHWTGPPLPHHRSQSGAARDPALDELRRLHDPDRSPFLARRRA